jgi:hypothetical protein
MKDGVFHRTLEVFDHVDASGKTEGVKPSTRDLFDLFDRLMDQARAAKATRLRISGKLISNPNVRKIDPLAKRFGGSARLIDDQNIEIEVPVPQAPHAEGAGDSRTRRTAMDPVDGQAPRPGSDLAMLNRARSSIRAKLLEMLNNNKVVETFTVEQVKFGGVTIKIVKDVLYFSSFEIRKDPSAPRDHGKLILQEFERAVVDVAQAKHARRVRGDLYVVNAKFAKALKERVSHPWKVDEKTKEGSTPKGGENPKVGGDKETEGESAPQRLFLEIEVSGSRGRGTVGDGPPRRSAPPPAPSKPPKAEPTADTKKGPPNPQTDISTGVPIVEVPDASPAAKTKPTSLDPATANLVVLERGRSQLRAKLNHLLSTGRSDVIKVEGVIFGVVQVKRVASASGPVLEVSYLTITKTREGAGIPGRGLLMQGALEAAARDIGGAEGAVSVRVRVNAVQNTIFGAELRKLGYERVGGTPDSEDLERELPPEP